MKTRLAVLWAAMLCLLGGCQARVEYWINPDGSGKVTYEYTQSAVGDEEGLSQFAENELSEATGVAAWSDVKFSFDGSMQHTKATAYFDDINQLQLGGTGRLFKLRAEKSGGGIASVRMGTDTSAFPPETDVLGNPIPNPPLKLSEAQLNERISKLREEEKRWSEFAEKEVAKNGRGIEVIIHLPGKPTESKGVDVMGNNTVTIALPTSKLKEAIGAASTDEKVLAEVAASGSSLIFGIFHPSGMQIVLTKLFGDREGPSVKIAPDAAPLFDYKAELKANQRSYREMAIAAGFVRASLPVVAEADKMRVVSPGPTSKGLTSIVERSFAGPRPPGSINVTILPPANTYAMLRTRLILMTDEQDRVVVPGPGANRSINSYSATVGDVANLPAIEDATNLTVRVPTGVKAVKRVQGYSTILKADGIERVELGEVDVKMGVKYGKMGVEFTMLSRTRGAVTAAVTQPGEQASFGLSCAPEWADKVAGVQLIGADGKVIVTMRGAQGKDGNLGGCAADAFPERVTMRVFLWKNPRIIDVPFEFEDYNQALAAYNESHAPKVPATAPASSK